MRKLVTIRRIDAIDPIPNADAIEVATVGGWKVVVKKDEFKVSDPVLYLEIDSWVPHELAPFLSKGKDPRTYLGVNGERLKTIKLRGQLSQGLILPLEELVKNGISFSYTKLGDSDPSCEAFEMGGSKFEEEPTWELLASGKSDDEIFDLLNEKTVAIGQGDVDGETVQFEDEHYLSWTLGVIKYEKPLPGQLVGKARGNFPGWIRKTDQERCQNLKREIFEDNIDSKYEVSIKLDGSSMTAYFKDGDVGVCSRNLNLKVDEEEGPSENHFVRMFIDSGLRDALIKIGQNVSVQGELIGPGIQGNREKLVNNMFMIFDIQGEGPGTYFTPIERADFVAELFSNGANYKMVRHIICPHYNKTLADLGITNIDELLTFAEGPSWNEDVIREGLVFKRMDGQFSFKTVSNKYLLEGGE